MSAGQYDLYIEQGATFRTVLTYLHRDGTVDVNGDPIAVPYDLTGCEVRMQIRQRRGTEVLISVTTANGAIVIDPDPTTGRMVITISDEATDSLTMSRARYDLEVEYPSGDVIRLIEGRVSISGNITQDTDLVNISPGVTTVYQVDEEDVAGPK